MKYYFDFDQKEAGILHIILKDELLINTNRHEECPE